ncbi:hypothetical protein [Embleya sp. AB8]|uniref:hypothetical protein n=1 Tax=Embleya sp. AB8 TaxID=3156304 RepID=UPI003C796273
MNSLDRALREQRRTLDEAFADYDPAAALQRLASRIVQERLAAELIRAPAAGNTGNTGNGGNKGYVASAVTAANPTTPTNPDTPIDPATPTNPTAPTNPTTATPGSRETIRTRAAVELEHLCRLVVARPDTATLLTEFVDHRAPAGGVVFGCLLYLTGRTEPAAFWWRFGAGAEDAEAMRFLVLHHCAENDPYDAEFWTRGIPTPDPHPTPAPVPQSVPDDPEPLADTYVARVEPGIRGVEDPDYGEVCVPHAWLKSHVQTTPTTRPPRRTPRTSCPTRN